MYNMNRKLKVVKDNYIKLREELEICLIEAITSDNDNNIIMGFTSSFKPVVFNIDPENMNVDYYDDIIYTVRNNGLCLMEWFDNDVNVLVKVTGSTYKEMKEFAADVMEKDYDDICYDDVLIALDTPAVNKKLLRERERIILDTYDFRKMATNILDTYMDFLRINFGEVD